MLLLAVPLLLAILLALPRSPDMGLPSLNSNKAMDSRHMVVHRLPTARRRDMVNLPLPQAMLPPRLATASLKPAQLPDSIKSSVR